MTVCWRLRRIAIRSRGKLPVWRGAATRWVVVVSGLGGLVLAIVRDVDSDRARVVSHLARVEAKLRAADVTALAPSQRAARAHHLNVLREYRLRGVYPHNHVVPDRRTPVFVDEHGTHCAVAYLIARSGREDLVQRIARTRNLARIAELAADVELRRWLETAGLALQEAAMIQPQYGDDIRSETSDSYATATIVATGVDAGLIAWNLVGEGRVAGILGLTSGLAQLGLGGLGVLARDGGSDPDIDAAHITTNLVVGSCAFILGLHSLHRYYAESPERAVAHRRAAAAWSLAPWTPGAGQAGMRVGLRF